MLFDNAAMLKFRLVTTIRDAMECGKIFIEVHEPRGFGVEDDDEDSGEDYLNFQLQN